MTRKYGRRLGESGERTRLACWRSRPRDRELFRFRRRNSKHKIVSARRRNQHARRVRSPEKSSSPAYFFFLFGFAAGDAVVGAVAGVIVGSGAGGAAFGVPSSMLNVQCVSTFLPPDFALTITVQFLSFSRWVTWYA